MEGMFRLDAARRADRALVVAVAEETDVSEIAGGVGTSVAVVPATD